MTTTVLPTTSLYVYAGITNNSPWKPEGFYEPRDWKGVTIPGVKTFQGRQPDVVATTHLLERKQRLALWDYSLNVCGLNTINHEVDSTTEKLTEQTEVLEGLHRAPEATRARLEAQIEESSTKLEALKVYQQRGQEYLQILRQYTIETWGIDPGIDCGEKMSNLIRTIGNSIR